LSYYNIGDRGSRSFAELYVDHDAMPDSYSGVVSVSNSVTTLGDEGAAIYHFTLAQAGTYDVAVKLGFPFWDKNNIHISLDGNEVDFSENRLWWPYWRTTFWTVLKKGVSLSQGTHTITISLGAKGVQFYGFRVCSSFSEEPSVGEAEYTLAPRHFKDVNGDMVGQSPQNFGKKLKRETITLEELKVIAEVMDVKFEQAFILPDGNEIKAGNE